MGDEGDVDHGKGPLSGVEWKVSIFSMESFSFGLKARCDILGVEVVGCIFLYCILVRFFKFFPRMYLAIPRS